MTATTSAQTQTTRDGDEAAKETKDMPLGVRHVPQLPLPGVHIGMPTGTPGRVLWWGGLAAVAAFDIVEWPVAVLVGAGSWVAEQYAKASAAQQSTMAAARQDAQAQQAS